MHQYDIVDAFERRVAEYAGAPYGVAVDSCTNAIKLCLVYDFMFNGPLAVYLPKYTYVGVPYAVLAAGGKCRFTDEEWKGEYDLKYKASIDSYSPGMYSLHIIDSARRFTSGMYGHRSDVFRCLSFHETKHLPIGRGGMILTASRKCYNDLRQMRFDGRTPGVDAKHDTYTLPGFHCNMKPDDAARGLMLMAGMPDHNDDLPNSDYPDLSKFPVFQEGYSWMR